LRERSHAAARDWAYPVAAFLLARAVVVAASLHAGTGWPSAADLSRADSFNYLSIAAHGYVLHPCPPACVPGVGLPWSGNAGWFPLYPLLLAPFSHLDEGAHAGVVVSGAFQLAAYALLWFVWLRREPLRRSLPVLALAAVFPGSVYYAAVFPMSLYVTVLLAGLLALGRGRISQATASSFFSALAYPTGWLLSVASALRFRHRPRSAVAPLVAAGLALAALVGAQWWMTDRWNAYFLSQSGRGHGVGNPLSALHFAETATVSFLHDPSRHDLTQYVQEILAAAIVVLTVVALAAARAQRRPGDLETTLLVVGMWLLPLTVGGLSLYRMDAALLPSLILLRRLPPFVTVAVAVACAPVAFLMDVLFFQGTLA
jgi:hypothetical protein